MSLRLNSEAKSKMGSGATFLADQVSDEYVVSHEETGLPANEKPAILVLNERNMSVVALTMVLANKAGLYTVACDIVDATIRHAAGRKAAEEAAALDRVNPDTEAATAAMDELLKKAGLQ